MIGWLDTVIRQAGAAALLALALGASLEYLFPPFPGDTVTVLGGVYAIRGGAPAPLVFAAVMAGSLGGALLDYFIGRWLGRRLASPDGERHWLTRQLGPTRLLEWQLRFQRRAALWLVVNRFLPAVRAPVFLAAGASRVPLAKVVLWGGVSALLWNGLLFGVGWAAGGQVERIEEFLRRYGRASWAALGLLALLLAFRWAWRRRTAIRRASSTATRDPSEAEPPPSPPRPR